MEEFFTSHSRGLITVAIILVGTVVFAWLADGFFRRMIRKKSKDLNNDPTNYQFLRHAATVLIYGIGLGLIIYSIPPLKAVAGTMLAGAGILAVAIGFASQQALSNIISGVFIVIFKPFRVNDRIRLRDMDGFVEDITLRHTVIRNFENRRIIIPNAIISDEVIVNSDYNDERICRFVDIGISYNSNVKRAKEIMFEEIVRHPLSIDIRTPEAIEAGAPQTIIRVIALADSSVNLRGTAWAGNSADAYAMGCDLLESLKERFEAEGISIPFPHRTVYLEGSNLPPQESPVPTSSSNN